MSLALIENLSDAAIALKKAMREADLSDMEQAMTRFRSSLDAVQAVGAWRSEPEIKAKIKAVINELEASRMLACLMGDMSGQMHMAHASRNLDAPQPLYGRPR